MSSSELPVSALDSRQQKLVANARIALGGGEIVNGSWDANAGFPDKRPR